MSGPRFDEVFSTTWKVVLSLLLISLGITVIYLLIVVISIAGSGPAASGSSYLYAAYAATWVIHIAYLGSLVRRYTRLRKEIEELAKK